MGGISISIIEVSGIENGVYATYVADKNFKKLLNFERIFCNNAICALINKIM